MTNKMKMQDTMMSSSKSAQFIQACETTLMAHAVNPTGLSVQIVKILIMVKWRKWELLHSECNRRKRL